MSSDSNNLQALQASVPLVQSLFPGGVKVDCCLRSSDPHIYAVGEVASYEGGMVYGLWKPGAEQAEVLAATLGSPSVGLRYHGSFQAAVGACPEIKQQVHFGLVKWQMHIEAPKRVCSCPVRRI